MICLLILIILPNFLLAMEMPKKGRAIGSSIDMNCPSNKTIDACHFTSPTGKVYRDIQRWTKNIHDGRVQCLCKNRINLDQTKNCGITIRNLQIEDSGTWTCTIKIGRKTQNDSGILNVVPEMTTAANKDGQCPTKSGKIC